LGQTFPKEADTRVSTAFDTMRGIEGATVTAVGFTPKAWSSRSGSDDVGSSGGAALHPGDLRPVDPSMA
jgi:hypothetical protein